MDDAVKLYEQGRLVIVTTDITRLEVDAIVNAANTSLLGGGGVDGAIHRAAGPKLLDECQQLNGCLPGEAKITAGYNLKAKYVIHAVGPVWHNGNQDEANILKRAYFNALQIASEYRMQSIAFPNISTGVYRFPKVLAAEIAISTVTQFLDMHQFPYKVLFAVFDKENETIYREKLVNAGFRESAQCGNQNRRMTGRDSCQTGENLA